MGKGAVVHLGISSYRCNAIMKFHVFYNLGVLAITPGLTSHGKLAHRVMCSMQVSFLSNPEVNSHGISHGCRQIGAENINTTCES